MDTFDVVFDDIFFDVWGGTIDAVFFGLGVTFCTFSCCFMAIQIVVSLFRECMITE